MTDQSTTERIAELKTLSEAVTQWSNCNQAWLDSSEDTPAATVGHINDDGETYPVAVVDCDQYYMAQDSIKLARFYAAANPQAILSLIEHIAELERKNAELVNALQEVRHWFEAERKSISKGNGSQWSIWQCEEQMEAIDTALASHHKEDKA